MKRKKACAALLCAAMTLSGFPLGGGIVSAQENKVQGTDFDIYVSPKGSDTEGDGSEAHPYATIDRAREAARELTADGDSVTVNVGEGKYFLEEPIVFGPEDSHVAYVGDNAVLTGAKTLENLEWENYEGEIQVASVEAGLGIDQLFIGGEQQTLARYPNYDADQVLQGSMSQADIKERSAGWEDPAGGYIRALHSNKWGGNSYRITGKNDSALGLSYEWVGDNNRGSGMLSSAVMVENIFEELDSPGEWYYDNEEGRLYVWPQEGTDLDSATVEGAVTEELLRIEGEQDGAQVTDLVFDGLTLENTKRTMFTGTYVPLMRSDWCVVRSGALFIQDAENVAFRNGTIRNIGGNAVFLSGHSKGVTIDNNEILNIGSSGILAAGFPDSCREASFWEYTSPLDPETDEKYVHKTTIDDATPGPQAEHYPREAVISNNHIQNVGIWEKQSSHVALSVAYKIQILHNTIHEGPRAGVNVGDGTFGGHEIAYNDIFDVQRETDDHGMFNSWGRDRFWSLGGFDTGGNRGAQKEPYSMIDAIETTTIHDNRMHFAGRVDGGTTFGIDLDDGSTNYEIYNNLCLNMGIKLREGFHRSVYNNIIVNAQINLHCTFEDSYDTIERNIVIMGTPYRLAATSESRFAVSEDVINNNWFYDFGMKINYPGDWWEELGLDADSVNADPMFRDTSSNDYTVTNEAAMETVGFKNFPMDQFGKPGCEYQSPVFEKTEPDGTVDALEREEWLGATISAVDDAIMSSTGAGGLDGVYMESVPEDSQAAKFGLETGDVLKSINGQTIGKKANFIPLYDAVGEGRAVSLVIVRNQLTEELNFIKYGTESVIDDQDGTIVYHGEGWETASPDKNPSNAADCIGKTMSYCNLTKEDRESVYIEVPFSGTQIEFFSRTEDNMGDYEITIRNADGEIVQQAVCSAYSTVRTDAVSLFKSDVLSKGDYTLTLKCLSGDYLIVDAFQVSSMQEGIDQIVVEPISVTADGVRVSELVSGQTLEITVPVINNGTEDLNVTAMAVLSGGDGAAQLESLVQDSAVAGADSRMEMDLTVELPEGSESRRLEIFVFNTESGKVYSYPRTIDGSAIVPYETVIPDAAEGELEYSYTAQSRLLTAAAEGFMPGVQATIEVTAEDGTYLGYRQQTVDGNGQVKCFFILPENTEGTVKIRICDESGATKWGETEIRADENIVNKDALKAAAEAVAAVLGDKEKEALYTKESWMTLYNAYYKALACLEDKDVTQADVNAAADALTEAMTGLEELLSENSYAPSSSNMGQVFRIFRNDGTEDGGNKDSGNGDQWQARASQVDTVFKGAYAEFKGNFISFMIDGADKYDSADFKVVITDDATGEIVAEDEVTQTRSQSGTVRIYEKSGLSGAAVTIRVYQNDDSSSERYLELKKITYIAQDPDAQSVPELTGIEVTKLPAATEYEEGSDDEISLLGGEITETYSDGSTNVIPMNNEMYTGGFDTETPGEKTVTVTHRGLTAQFIVTVKGEPEPVSKTTLGYFLNQAKSYVEDGTVSGLVESIQKMFTDAIAKGEAVMADENATREEVLDVAADLMFAIHALDMKAADKTDLEMALELAEMIDLSKYVEAGQAEFLAARDAAEAVRADGDAMQAETDEAWNSLVEAMNALRLKADKSVLEDLISQMEGMDLSGYTEESVTEFRAAFAAANAVLTDEALSADDQAKVDEAVNALRAAYDGLEKTQSGGPEDPGTGSGDADDPQTPDGDSGHQGGTAGDAGNNGTAKAAKTGDTAPVAAAGMLVMISAAAMTAIILRRKNTK